MAKKKIAIAEDDTAILQLLKSLLSEEGYDVLSFPDVQSFKTVLQNSILPDLIILDIWIDGDKEAGESLARTLKAGQETHRIPIIIVSASSEIQKIQKQVGADDFISKPFEIDEVIEKVNFFLSPRQ